MDDKPPKDAEHIVEIVRLSGKRIATFNPLAHGAPGFFFRLFRRVRVSLDCVKKSHFEVKDAR